MIISNIEQIGCV